MKGPLVSILINNRNYAAYLAEAIESALRQTYTPVEVVVVDDGSTDDSRVVMDRYAGKIEAVERPHVGQAAAFNAAVEAARGEVLFFLDADDVCEERRVEEVMTVLLEVDPVVEGAALLFHPQRFCDAAGRATPKVFPPRLVRIEAYRRGIRAESFAEGAMAVISTPTQAGQFLVDKHYLPFLSSATSGMAITRPMAQRLFPLPERGITICADSFLSLGALLEGPVILVNRELSRFRMHGKNRYMLSRKRPNADLFFNQRDAYLNALAARQGLPQAILTLDNWERVRRYLRNKPIREILVLLMRSETRQYAAMLLRGLVSRAVAGCWRGRLAGPALSVPVSMVGPLEASKSGHLPKAARGLSS
jgi:glycosyltransferase involved in cell wall biosynthesis